MNQKLDKPKKKLSSEPPDKGLLGTKVQLTLSRRTFARYGSTYSLPEYTLDDPKFIKKVNELYSNYKIFLPSTVLSSDHTPGQVKIYIEPDGTVSHISKS